MVARRTTQTTPNAMALGRKASKAAKDQFMNSVMDSTGLTYAQFMEKAKANPNKNFLILEKNEDEAVILALEDVILSLQTVLDNIRKTL